MFVASLGEITVCVKKINYLIINCNRKLELTTELLREDKLFMKLHDLFSSHAVFVQEMLLCRLGTVYSNMDNSKLQSNHNSNI